MIYIRKARGWTSVWLSKDTGVEMQRKIAAWFPHMKVRHGSTAWSNDYCESGRTLSFVNGE
jgi:hypothetical protein